MGRRLPGRMDPRRRAMTRNAAEIHAAHALTADIVDTGREIRQTVTAWFQGVPVRSTVLVVTRQKPAEAADPTRGRRCSICALCWPPTDTYRACPVCGEDTGRVMRGLTDVMSEQEARDLARTLHDPE